MITIDSLEPHHWDSVRTIYLEGIATGHATFETEAPTWESWNKAHLETCRLVATEDDQVIGWAALTAVSGRCVYAGVGEISVYVADRARGKGIGKLLLKKLITASEQNGLWTLQSGIFPENVASLRLHESLGFREIGRRERIGKMNGVWRDTVLLEHRSPTIGQD
jgi:L-amino acid N-acyltransferase YncA